MEESFWKRLWTCRQTEYWIINKSHVCAVRQRRWEHYVPCPPVSARPCKFGLCILTSAVHLYCRSVFSATSATKFESCTKAVIAAGDWISAAITFPVRKCPSCIQNLKLLVAVHVHFTGTGVSRVAFPVTCVRLCEIPCTVRAWWLWCQIAKKRKTSPQPLNTSYSGYEDSQ